MRHEEQHRRGARRFRAPRVVPILALAASLSLGGCSAEPVAAWQPPEFAPVTGAVLLDETGGETQTPDADSSGENEAQGAVETGSGADPAALDQHELGLMPERLRNDDLGFAARFVYVPGVPDFNERVNAEVRSAIAATGGEYTPQVHPVGSGLDDRGCVEGSAGWSADEVLERPETAPAGEAGTAVTCDVTAAFGDLIEVRLRVVTGKPGAVSTDHTTVLFANVADGSVLEVASQWNDHAAAELWTLAMDLLRREAGALSSAPIAAPSEAQLALARNALVGAKWTEDGGLLVRLPPDLASPELEGLGIDFTSQPTQLGIDPETARAWTNEAYLQVHAALDTPFSGVTGTPSRVPIDCDLIPCVALTYDDGPGPFTSRLVDTLIAERARATFFMLGDRVDAHADTVARIIAEGNEIGSHTMTHPDLTELPLPEATAQVLDAADAIERASGEPVTLFRPPYGEVNDEIIDAVQLPAILWSIDTNDWQEPGEPALIERSVSAADPGDVILFHDIHSDSVEVASDVIRGMRDRGFETVTVTELFDGSVPEGRVSSR